MKNLTLINNVVSFTVDQRFILDLKDDFVMNEDLTLYEFIGSDPIKAFYLGLNITDWFEQLDKKQKYLYSKQIRHNKDDLEKYLDQIKFWTEKFQNSSDEIDITELAEFIINNMFWEEKTEDLDRVKMAFFFGSTIAIQQANQDESEKSEDNN